MKKIIAILLSLSVISCGIRDINSDKNWKEIVFGSNNQSPSDLVFFSVPNSINYAVDFKNSTIYLPNKKARKLTIWQIEKSDMYAVKIDNRHFDSKTIESIVGAEAGCGVDFKKSEAYKIKDGKKIKIS